MNFLGMINLTTAQRLKLPRTFKICGCMTFVFHFTTYWAVMLYLQLDPVTELMLDIYN